MTEQTKHINSAERQMMIPTNIPLWRLLLQTRKKSQKLSRPEAFFDLIERQQIAILKGETPNLKGSIFELAKAWGWDRDTVVRFLDGLESLGAISSEMLSNRKTFQLKYEIVNQEDSGAP